MKELNRKLPLFKNKIEANQPISIMIIGLGSVGMYLLDNLINLSNPQLHIIVVGRNREKMATDVNIIKVSATIREALRSKITLECGVDLNYIDSIADVISKHKPDFIVNTSRVYPGIKYGNISWHYFRSYGIWAPLSILYARNIIEACYESDSNAITINSSYSDAVIPWLKSAGKPYFNFGSGNLNHLIPRMKSYIAAKNGFENLNDIDITLATSHYHDMLISKEGHAGEQGLLLDIRYKDNPINFNQAAVLEACTLPLPTDQKCNMMNAASIFNIIYSVIDAIKNNKKKKIHSPGISGEIGGYPVILDGEDNDIKCYLDNSIFSLREMREANKKSIYLDGIEDVKEGNLIYTDELTSTVKKAFGVTLPKVTSFEDIDRISKLLVDNFLITNKIHGNI